MDTADAAGGQPPLDLIIIGAGLGGVIALHYARKAGLRVLLLERQGVVGGLWAQLPAWQDIQFGRADWTLGDLPIGGEDQASIRANIQAWVDRFGLADAMRLNTEVTRASRDAEGHWCVETAGGTYRAPHLIAATGAHNLPRIPAPARESVTLRELHSSALRDAGELAGRDVVVVGGGASAYDLLDLCFEHAARRVVWVHRRTRWMAPTLKPKNVAGSPRGLGRAQMEGASDAQISLGMHADLAGRYAKYGMQDIQPDDAFDLGRHQLVPGRWRMVANYPKIERHRGEVVRVAGRRVELSTGALDADLLLWGTGYEIDLGFFANPALARIRRHDELFAQCGSGARALAEPGLYFMAAGLESTGVAPWSYALLARTLISHLRGDATLEAVPLADKLNYFRLPAFLAARDPVNFPAGQWEPAYRRLAIDHPADQPLPIPE